MPLIKHEIISEERLADAGLYLRARKDDPSSILQGVAMANLVGLVRQLGDLSDYAAGVFESLQDDFQKTVKRREDLLVRVRDLNKIFPKIEENTLKNANSLQYVEVKGLEWKPKPKIEESLILNAPIPSFISEISSEIRAPPPLNLLDRHEKEEKNKKVNSESKYMLGYSDPGFFRREWTRLISAKLAQEARIKREKKRRRGRAEGGEGAFAYLSLPIHMQEHMDSGSSGDSQLPPNTPKDPQPSGNVLEASGQTIPPKSPNPPSLGRRQKPQITPPPGKTFMRPAPIEVPSTSGTVGESGLGGEKLDTPSGSRYAALTWSPVPSRTMVPEDFRDAPSLGNSGKFAPKKRGSDGVLNPEKLAEIFSKIPEKLKGSEPKKEEKTGGKEGETEPAPLIGLERVSSSGYLHLDEVSDRVQGQTGEKLGEEGEEENDTGTDVGTDAGTENESFLLFFGNEERDVDEVWPPSPGGSGPISPLGSPGGSSSVSGSVVRVSSPYRRFAPSPTRRLLKSPEHNLGGWRGRNAARLGVPESTKGESSQDPDGKDPKIQEEPKTPTRVQDGSGASLGGSSGSFRETSSSEFPRASSPKLVSSNSSVYMKLPGNSRRNLGFSTGHSLTKWGESGGKTGVKTGGKGGKSGGAPQLAMASARDPGQLEKLSRQKKAAGRRGGSGGGIGGKGLSPDRGKKKEGVKFLGGNGGEVGFREGVQSGGKVVDESGLLEGKSAMKSGKVRDVEMKKVHFQGQKVQSNNDNLEKEKVEGKERIVQEIGKLKEEGFKSTVSEKDGEREKEGKVQKYNLTKDQKVHNKVDKEKVEKGKEFNAEESTKTVLSESQIPEEITSKFVPTQNQASDTVRSVQSTESRDSLSSRISSESKKSSDSRGSTPPPVHLQTLQMRDKSHKDRRQLSRSISARSANPNQVPEPSPECGLRFRSTFQASFQPGSTSTEKEEKGEFQKTSISGSISEDSFDTEEEKSVGGFSKGKVVDSSQQKSTAMDQEQSTLDDPPKSQHPQSESKKPTPEIHGLQKSSEARLKGGLDWNQSPVHPSQPKLRLPPGKVDRFKGSPDLQSKKSTEVDPDIDRRGAWSPRGPGGQQFSNSPVRSPLVKNLSQNEVKVKQSQESTTKFPDRSMSEISSERVLTRQEKKDKDGQKSETESETEKGKKAPLRVSRRQRIPSPVVKPSSESGVERLPHPNQINNDLKSQETREKNEQDSNLRSNPLYSSLPN